eukprot:363429-Chlamydomonas_euryale.AAC.30
MSISPSLLQSLEHIPELVAEPGAYSRACCRAWSRAEFCLPHPGASTLKEARPARQPAMHTTYCKGQTGRCGQAGAGQLQPLQPGACGVELTCEVWESAAF